MTASLLVQCLLGMRCDDFTMIAADQTASQSIVVMKQDQDKLYDVNDMVIGIIGDAADAVQFINFISKNIHLYYIRNGYQLDTPAAVHFIRKNLMEGLRSATPTTVNLLVGGYSEPEGGQLYTLDYLASSMKVPFAVHGFGGMLSLAILDRYHKPTLTEAQAYDILKLCVHEIQQRLFIHLSNFQVKVVSKNGIKMLPTINAASFSSSP